MVDSTILRKKPACVLRRDNLLTELRQLEDRESLRPWLYKYGCFEKKNARSATGMVHLDNLKELAKIFRLHKSIPNFFRDYTTEDSLVAVLKRYVRNNAAFLSATPCEARTPRAANPQTGIGDTTVANGGDVSYMIGHKQPMDSTFLPLEGGGVSNSGSVRVAVRDDSSGVSIAELTGTSTGDGAHQSQRVCRVDSTHAGVMSSDFANACGTGNASTSGPVSKGSGFAPPGTTHATAGEHCQQPSNGEPRRPTQPKPRTKASVLLNPNAGGRRLFGHPDANNMAGMIRMSRMSLSHEIVDRLQVILHKNRRTRKYLGVHRAPAELSTRGAGVGSPGVNGTGGAGDERGGISGAPTGGRQGAQTVLGGQGIVLTSKQSAPSGGLITQRNSEEDQDGDISLEDAQSSRLRDSGDCAEREVDDIGDNDYSKTLKLKAAQALFRMSLEHGGEMKMVRDGVVIALMKLAAFESVLIYRLVSGCLANLTTARNVTWELLRVDGHEVLAFLVNGAKTSDPITLANVANALCRCSYEARNHHRLVSEFNTAQALCYIMQRQVVDLKITSAKGVLNICGLSSTMPALAAKLDVWMVTLCSAMEDLARNEKEAVQIFVCQGIQGLTFVQACLTRISDSGIVDLFLPLVRLNQKRPDNLARLAAAVVNLADLPSARAQLVKQKDIVAVLCLLAANSRLVESCCVAAASLSRTPDLEAHLVPLATTLAEVNVPNENAADCIAYFLQNITRSYPINETAVTSWLAVEADSASSAGRLACLCAVGHLIRNREDADTPLLHAGLMGTLHAILDESSASDAQGSATADPSSSAAAPKNPGSRFLDRFGKDGTSTLTPSPPSNIVVSAPGIKAGGAAMWKAAATAHRRKKHRDDLMPTGVGMMDRILTVIAKICFLLTLRPKNRPRLVQHGLPGLCAKILNLTKDDNIHFMAVACMYSLARSPNLRSDIAESGAVEVALEALAQSNPGHESEYILAQLAMVTQMAGEPKVLRRLASTATMDLLEHLSLECSEGKKTDPTPPTFDAFDAKKRSSSDDGNGGDKKHDHGMEDSLEAYSLSLGSVGKEDRAQSVGTTTSPNMALNPGNREYTISPHKSTMRYGVVTIAYHLGTTLDEGGAFFRKLSPSETSSVVEKLVHIVCSVVLASGQDEGVMGCCARVMAEWSIDPKFSREMGIKSRTGLSLAVLMRSVAPTTTARASTALCNIAAANNVNVRLSSGDASPHVDCAPTSTNKAKVIANSGEGTNDGGSVNTEDSGQHEGDYGKNGPGSDVLGGVVDDDRCWLKSTDILRDIITTGLVRSTVEVKGNLIKAINNLMCSEETRAALVSSNYMPVLFELVRGSNPEIRELASEMVHNLTCERRFHTTLLEAGVTYALLEILGAFQLGVPQTPPTATRGNHALPAPTNFAVCRVTNAQPPSQTVAQSHNIAKNQAMAISGDKEAFPASKANINAPEASVETHASGDVCEIDTAANAQKDVENDMRHGGTTPYGLGQIKPGGMSMIELEVPGIGRAGGIDGGDIVGVDGEGARATLIVRRNVLGALMNLTAFSLSHPKLDPPLVMALLGLITQEDPQECDFQEVFFGYNLTTMVAVTCSPDEGALSNFWISWQAVIFQLSFVEHYRSLIVYHGEGRVFQHIKLTNDPLSGKSSVVNPSCDRAYKRLVMGTMVNIACEPLLYEKLEGQVQVLREFLAEYEQEASGSCASGSNGGGNAGDFNLGSGSVLDTDMGYTNGEGDGIGVGDHLSRGRDWVRHELCGKLVLNLFSSKSFRERLSKKPIAGILVGLLCGPPTCRSMHPAQSNASTPETPTRPTRSRDTLGRLPASSPGRFGYGASGSKWGSSKPKQRGLLPEGSGEQRPALYSGGEEVAAIVSRFLCEMCILYSAEGGFELPQRTFEALVRVAHYYNYNASASATSTAEVNLCGIGGESETGAVGKPLNDTREEDRHEKDVRGPGEDGLVLSLSDKSSSTAQSAVGDSLWRLQASLLCGEGDAAWLMAAREVTTLWIRAVGSLCCPSHSELWPLMIDAGILGALYTISKDGEGLVICSAALRILSTATPPRTLRSDQAAACFGAVQRLLSRGADQPQVRMECTAALVNFVDASQTEDLQTLGIVGLLSNLCRSYEEHESDEPSIKLVHDLTLYSLSKLCTRDFVPTGDGVVSTITAMMDFDDQTVKRLEDLAKTLVAPPLPLAGPWKFQQPKESLYASAVAVLNKRSRHDERCSSMSSDRQGWREHASEAESGGGEDSRFLESGVRWKLRVACSEGKIPGESLEKASVAGPSSERARPDPTKHDLNKGQGRGQGSTGGGILRTGVVLGNAATGNREGIGPEEVGCKTSGVKSDAPASSSIADVTKTFAGGGEGRNGPSTTQKLKTNATKANTTATETSTVSAFTSSLEARKSPSSSEESGCGKRETNKNWSMAKPEKAAPVTGTTLRTTGPVPADSRQGTPSVTSFDSASPGSVDLDLRILGNPMLTAEDPPFELPWLINFSKADRMRLFRESMEGAFNGVSWPHYSESSMTRVAEEAENEDGFQIFTIPNDKWVSPDIPPEAGRTLPALVNGSRGGGGSARPLTINNRARNAVSGTNLASQQQTGLLKKPALRR